MKELTFENYLDLPKLVIESSREMEILVSSDLINKYYNSGLRRYLMKYFDKYNDTGFVFNIGYENKVTPLYGEEIVVTSNVSDKVNNFVTNKLDRQLWAYYFYECLLDLSKKLTKREAKYLIRTYFNKYSEEVISEELNLSRSGLQKIKRSALVKVYLEFECNDRIKF